jgi:hypothetical protein
MTHFDIKHYLDPEAFNGEEDLMRDWAKVVRKNIASCFEDSTDTYTLTIYLEACPGDLETVVSNDYFGEDYDRYTAMKEKGDDLYWQASSGWDEWSAHNI